MESPRKLWKVVAVYAPRLTPSLKDASEFVAGPYGHSGYWVPKTKVGMELPPGPVGQSWTWHAYGEVQADAIALVKRTYCFKGVRDGFIFHAFEVKEEEKALVLRASA